MTLDLEVLSLQDLPADVSPEDPDPSRSEGQTDRDRNSGEAPGQKAWLFLRSLVALRDGSDVFVPSLAPELCDG